MDTTAELVQLIGAFCATVVAMVKGTSEDKSFVHRSREAYDSLKISIRSTAPDFRPFEDPSQYRKPSGPSSEPSVKVVDDARSDVSACSRPASPLSVIDSPAPANGTSPPLEHEADNVSVMGLMDVRRIIKE